MNTPPIANKFVISTRIFMQNGTVQNKNAGGQRLLSEEVFQKIRDAFHANRRISLRATEVGNGIY